MWSWKNNKTVREAAAAAGAPTDFKKVYSLRRTGITLGLPNNGGSGSLLFSVRVRQARVDIHEK